MHTNETRLDELDVKFFKELPFLVEVFASSFNNLKEIIEAHFEELEKEITNFVKNNSNWEAKDTSYYFTVFRTQEKKQKPIQSLSSQLAFDKQLTVTGSVSGAKKSFIVSCGLFYADWAENGKPFLYIGIYRYKVSLETQMLPLEFYKKFDVANYKKEIYHPAEDDDEEEETIEIRVFEINENEINKAFQIFSKQVLQPYLRELERVYKEKQKIKK
jgi:hypothetical protein